MKYFHKINYFLYFIQRILWKLEIHDWGEWRLSEFDVVYRECKLCNAIENPPCSPDKWDTYLEK